MARYARRSNEEYRLGENLLYKKWLAYTHQFPRKSILIAVFIGSVIGMLGEYIINKDIHWEGLFPLVFLTAIQVYLVGRKK